VSKLAMESEEFAQFLRDPTVPLKQKSTVLQEVLSSVKVNDLTKNFFSAAPPPPPPPEHPRASTAHACSAGSTPCAPAAVVLAENNRLNLFDKVVDTFGELMAASRGQVSCTITSAEVRSGARELLSIACLSPRAHSCACVCLSSRWERRTWRTSRRA